MELDELKNSWNALNERLAESKVVNQRMVKEIIAQKTKSAFERIYRIDLYNFFITIIIGFLAFPLICMGTPITTTSFVIVEIGVLCGLLLHLRRLNLLSKFNLEDKTCTELRGLVLRYKQACQQDTYKIIAIVSLTMVAFYISELGFNEAVHYELDIRILWVIVLTLLTFVVAYIVAKWQLRRQEQEMLEIEQGLKELKEFED